MNPHWNLALADVSAEHKDEEAMQSFPVRCKGTLLHCIAPSLFLPLLGHIAATVLLGLHFGQ